MIAHQYEKIEKARLGSEALRVFPILFKDLRIRCETWGDLASLSADSLHAAPGVSDAMITSLHRALERGPTALVKQVPASKASDVALSGKKEPPSGGTKQQAVSVSHVALRDRYEWLADAAKEEIDRSIFDSRVLYVLLTVNVRTWGELGAHSDASLFGIQNFDMPALGRLHQALSAYEYKGKNPVIAAATIAESLAESEGDADSAVFDSKPEEGNTPPTKVVLGERYPWLFAHRYESVEYSSFESEAFQMFKHLFGHLNVWCGTWGDLAELSDDDLRAAPGVSDAMIGCLHRNLERGPTSLMKEVPAPVSSKMALREKYRWMADAAEEEIDPSIFDANALKALRRHNILTWGELGSLSDASLFRVRGFGLLSVGQLNEALSAYDPEGAKCSGVDAAASGSSLEVEHGSALPSFDSMARDGSEEFELFNLGRVESIDPFGIQGTWMEHPFAELDLWPIAHQQKSMDLSWLDASAQTALRSIESSIWGDSVMVPEDDPDTALFNLQGSAEWSTVVSDNATLGELLAAVRSEANIPECVGAEVDALFAVPLAALSGHTATPLGELLEQLLLSASDPELLVSRECVREKPTLELLGEQKGLTRERIRQIVAKDAKLVRGLLESDQFRAVRWAAERLQSEFGLAISPESEVTERWVTRLGERRFEMLRWISGYTYKDGWLLNGAGALADLRKELGDVLGDEWLVAADKLIAALSIHVHPEVALGVLLDSGKWRDIGDGWLVRWDGAIQHKAERILRLTCRPMTPHELIEAIGHGSVGSLKNQHGSNLIRVDKEFRLALREWGLEEYEGIVTEITQRIERGGGVASKAAIIDEFTNHFGISVVSINMNLGLPIFNVVGDSVRFADSFSFDPLSPSTVAGAVQTRNGWGQRHIVTEENMNGYSFGINPHIAWANGLRPSDSLVVGVNGSPLHEASVIWRVTNLNGAVEVGRLRRWLEEREVGPGVNILLCPTPTGVSVHVGEDEIQSARPVPPPIAPDVAAMMEDL